MGRNWIARTPRAQTRDLELGVEAGQVVCPRSGIVDIERCFACGAYRGMRQDGPERLICAPTTSRERSYVPFSVVPR
jgi:hypothetical protein